MTAPRLGLTTLVLGAAIWVQVALLPVIARAAELPSIALATCSLVILTAGGVLSMRRPGRGIALIVGAFPLSLGLFSLALGRHDAPRFDAPARAVAAATGAAFLAAAVAWASTFRPAWPVALSSLGESPSSAPAAPAARGSVGPSSGLRRVALSAVALVASFTAVIAPSILAAREPMGLDERIGGEELLRGRHALVAAAGLLIAVALILGGGGAIARASPPRPRRGGRALAYLVWAFAAVVMRYWLDHAP